MLGAFLWMLKDFISTPRRNVGTWTTAGRVHIWHGRMDLIGGFGTITWNRWRNQKSAARTPAQVIHIHNIALQIRLVIGVFCHHCMYIHAYLLCITLHHSCPCPSCSSASPSRWSCPPSPSTRCGSPCTSRCRTRCWNGGTAPVRGRCQTRSLSSSSLRREGARRRAWCWSAPLAWLLSDLLPLRRPEAPLRRRAWWCSFLKGDHKATQTYIYICRPTIEKS